MFTGAYWMEIPPPALAHHRYLEIKLHVHVLPKPAGVIIPEGLGVSEGLGADGGMRDAGLFSLPLPPFRCCRTLTSSTGLLCSSRSRTAPPRSGAGQVSA